MKNTMIVLLLGLAAMFTNCAKVSIKSVEDLDATISKTFDKSPMVGCAISVVKADKVLFQKSYGQADMAKNTPYTNQTTQPIASISKIFVGVALMRAIEQGLLTLETPINDILPFVVKNPAFPNQVIRIKHLATHTSGINDLEATYFANHSILTGENVGGVEAQRMINELKFKQNSMITPLKDFMKEYFTAGNALYSSKNFNPTEAGTAYRYSNIGAALAAYLIEVKTGQSFAEYCNAQIFNPLGMSSTSWFLTNAVRPKMATLYWEKNKPLPFYTAATYPDGSLITSNEDLTKFLVEMIKGFSGTSNFLKKSAFDLLFQKQFTGATPINFPSKETNSGVFWVYFSNGRLGHTGGDLGVTTIAAFYPDTKTGFVFLSNSETENLEDNVAIRTAQNIIFGKIREFEKNNER